MLGGGGVSHPSQLTTGLVIKSVTTSPTLAGERMLFILQVSILSEQTFNITVLIKTQRLLVKRVNKTPVTWTNRQSTKSKERRHRAVTLMAPKNGMTSSG